jgi:hypothetical protein
MEKMRVNAKASLKKQLCDAPFFKSQAELEAYVTRIDEGIYSEFKKPDDYLDQLTSILANASNIRNFLHEFDPFHLGKCDPSSIAPKAARIRQKREKIKRARETESYDQTSMFCSECRKVRRDRVNQNRMGLDSDELGTQFDTNFENYCVCDDAKWEAEADADAEKKSDDGDASEVSESVSSTLSEDE